jgi:hypothetical protein
LLRASGEGTRKDSIRRGSRPLGARGRSRSGLSSPPPLHLRSLGAMQERVTEASSARTQQWTSPASEKTLTKDSYSPRCPVVSAARRRSGSTADTELTIARKPQPRCGSSGYQWPSNRLVSSSCARVSRARRGEPSVRAVASRKYQRRARPLKVVLPAVIGHRRRVVHESRSVGQAVVLTFKRSTKIARCSFGSKSCQIATRTGFRL